MSPYYSATATIGSVLVNIERMSPTKVVSARKQVINKRVVLLEIPYRDLQDWRLEMTINLINTSRDADRLTLEGYNDGGIITFTDGVHDGDYHVISLGVDDSQKDRPCEHVLKIVLLQAQ